MIDTEDLFQLPTYPFWKLVPIHPEERNRSALFNQIDIESFIMK